MKFIRTDLKFKILRFLYNRSILKAWSDDQARL